MRKALLSLSVLAVLASPLAVATSGPIFCPTYNPDALTNACVWADTTSRPVSHPYVDGFAPKTICVISTLCFTAPAPTLGTTTTNVPGVTGSGTYVEATALCTAVSKCRVSWSDIERALAAIATDAINTDILDVSA